HRRTAPHCPGALHWQIVSRAVHGSSSLATPIHIAHIAAVAARLMAGRTPRPNQANTTIRDSWRQKAVLGRFADELNGKGARAIIDRWCTSCGLAGELTSAYRRRVWSAALTSGGARRQRSKRPQARHALQVHRLREPIEGATVPLHVREAPSAAE